MLSPLGLLTAVFYRRSRYNQSKAVPSIWDVFFAAFFQYSFARPYSEYPHLVRNAPVIVMKMETRNSGLPQALALHQQGHVEEAIPLYQAFLRANRKHAGAANLLGVALMQAGRLHEAEAAIRNALRLNSSQASAHYNLGTVMQALSRNEEALTFFEKAIALNPKDAQFYNNLGVTLKTLGRLEEAVGMYRRAIMIQPDLVQAHANLASALCGLDRYDEGVEAGEQALAINPKLCEVLVTIGNALFELGKKIDALQAFDRAIALQPNRSEAYYCAGNILMGMNREARALEYLRRAVFLNPESPNARFRLAICLNGLKLLDEASAEAKKAFQDLKEAAVAVSDVISAGSYLTAINKNNEALTYFKRALALDPKSIAALEGYANAAGLSQLSNEAVQLFDQILQRKPDAADIKSFKGIVALTIGDFAEGWRLAESRFLVDRTEERVRNYSIPRWSGERIAGPLLIWGEQGLGDQIIYASMIPDVERCADSVILEIEPRLIPLFQRSFPKVEIRPQNREIDEEEIVAHSPIGSLGGFFRLGWNDFPRRPFLVTDQKRTSKLKTFIHAGTKCVIGVSWRSANRKMGEHKTASLLDFSSVLHERDLDFVDLQYGETADELTAIRKDSGVVIKHIDEIDNKNDIDGLAALIEACDAIVTVSNTTAHLAGALGKPVWILIPHGQGRIWYWFKDRKDSPWYPGARIVRQQPGQPWADLVASITPEIVEFAANLKKEK